MRAGHANMFLSPLFARAFADVTGAAVELYETDGAQGAARGAGVGAGVFGSAAKPSPVSRPSSDRTGRPPSRAVPPRSTPAGARPWTGNSKRQQASPAVCSRQLAVARTRAAYCLLNCHVRHVAHSSRAAAALRRAPGCGRRPGPPPAYRGTRPSGCAPGSSGCAPCGRPCRSRTPPPSGGPP